MTDHHQQSEAFQIDVNVSNHVVCISVNFSSLFICTIDYSENCRHNVKIYSALFFCFTALSKMAYSILTAALFLLSPPHSTSKKKFLYIGLKDQKVGKNLIYGSSL